MRTTFTPIEGAETLAFLADNGTHIVAVEKRWNPVARTTLWAADIHVEGGRKTFWGHSRAIAAHDAFRALATRRLTEQLPPRRRPDWKIITNKENSK